MTTTIQQNTRSISRRFVAGMAVLFVVGVFFVLPLCAAMTLCSMPCCHPENGSGSVVTTDMAGCATECAIRSDEAKSTTVATVTSDSGNVQRIAPAVIAIVHFAETSGPLTAIERDAGRAHRAADAPLHVLNSTFRI